MPTASFDTEENYGLVQKKGVKSHLKFPRFPNKQKKKYQNFPFPKDKFRNYPFADTCICPYQQQLRLHSNYKQIQPRTGYKSLIKDYACSLTVLAARAISGCKSGKGHNRSIKVNQRLANHKQQARANKNSHKGFDLRKPRSIEIESCFDDINSNISPYPFKGVKR